MESTLIQIKKAFTGKRDRPLPKVTQKTKATNKLKTSSFLILTLFYRFYLVSDGIPLIIVGVTAAFDLENYGSRKDAL